MISFSFYLTPLACLLLASHNLSFTKEYIWTQFFHRDLFPLFGIS